MTPLEKRLHFSKLSQLPCMASGKHPVQIHHTLGGSMLERVGVRGTRKSSHWLAIPLAYSHHQGEFGIHTLGVSQWEAQFGTQAEMIDSLCKLLRLDLWALAESERGEKKRSSLSSKKLIAHKGTL